MAVTAGKDYALSLHVRTLLPGAGPCKASAIVTRRALYAIHAASRALVTQIDGVPPSVFIARLVADPAMTPELLDQTLIKESAAPRVSIVKQLADVKRIKLRSGFFTRSFAVSALADGMFGKFPTENFGWRIAKDEIATYTALFAGDPRLC